MPDNVSKLMRVWRGFGQFCEGGTPKKLSVAIELCAVDIKELVVHFKLFFAYHSSINLTIIFSCDFSIQKTYIYKIIRFYIINLTLEEVILCQDI